MSTEESEKVQEIVAEGVAREGLQEMVLPASMIQGACEVCY